MASFHDGFFVCFWSTSFDRSDETGTDPNGLSTPSEVGSQTPTVVDGTGTNDVDGLSGERGFVSLASVNNGRDEDRSGHIAGVASTLTSLRANKINANSERFGDVFRVSDDLPVVSVGGR